MKAKILWNATNNESNMMTQHARVVDIDGQKILEVLCLPTSIFSRIKSAFKLLFGYRAFVYVHVMLDSDFEKIYKENV